MRELQMKIYGNSPVFIQNILANLEGYRKSQRRFGPVYYNYLKELENRDYSDAAMLKTYQEIEMRRLIRHAVNHSPFYQEFYKDVDIDSIRTISDLKNLPVLKKEFLRSQPERFYTIPEGDAVATQTSGTSGIPMKFLNTRENIQKRSAHLAFFKKQHGAVNIEMKRASFSPSKFIPKEQKKKIYWRDNLSIKQRLYSTYYCYEETAGIFAQNLNDYRPDFIDGLPSAIYEVARWINQTGYKLKFRPVAIFPTSETLYPHYREEIERAFQCPVRNQYSSSEGSPFISECVQGNLHYHTDTGVIEVTDEGEMLVTCFFTYGTPLIRYQIGDAAKLSDSAARCSCGSALPLVDYIQGRSNEYVLSKNGRKYMYMHLSSTSPELAATVKKMQYIQTEQGKVTVLLEAAPEDREQAVQVMSDKLAYIFNDDMDVEIQLVDEIPKGPNSKFRLIQNQLA